MPTSKTKHATGRPKGSGGFDKEQARKLLRERVFANMQAMTDAQIANAQGIKYLVVREKGTGKFVRVTEAMAKARLGKAEEIIEIWEKDPSVQAFTDLMNRTIDKPTEHLQAEVDLSARGLEALLVAGRQRAAARGK